MREWRHRVRKSEAGGRLDRFLEQKLPELTRSQIKRLVDRSLVLVEGRRAKAGHALRAGESLEVTIPPPPALVPEPSGVPVPVVYEDDALVVVDKPAGMVVHPGAGRTRDTLVSALLGRGTPLSGMGSPQRPGIVHRLDKGTSGLMVVAKTDAAHRGLSRDLAERRVERRYWALVWGTPKAERGRITGALARSRADRRRMRVVDRGGREAATRYMVRGTWSGVSVVVLALETGRTHQIRVHFRHEGHPVFGDPDYGGRRRSVGARDREPVRRALAALDRQALHAWTLRFRHPVTGRTLVFTSLLPDDIRSASSELGVPPKVLADAIEEDP